MKIFKTERKDRGHRIYEEVEVALRIKIRESYLVGCGMDLLVKANEYSEKEWFDLEGIRRSKLRQKRM